MELVQAELEAAAATFAGVLRVELNGATVHQSAYGMANRASAIANTPATRFGIASGAKGFTALTTMRLIERDVLSLDTTARSLLGNDLPDIDDRVTVRHLLAHRSGIGDYLDEEEMGDIADYAMPVPVHELCTPEAYLPALAGRPTKNAPDVRFAYNNSGFAVLAILLERAADRSFYELVDELVCEPAGLQSTAFLRSDELPGDAALGYLATDGLRTNVLHLPVRGSGDGGIFTTVDDVGKLWRAVFAGEVVHPSTWREMITPLSTTDDGWRYGLGFWLDPTTDAVTLTGYDAGVSFRTNYRPSTDLLWTVLSNTSEGAWPLTKLLTQTFS